MTTTSTIATATAATTTTTSQKSNNKKKQLNNDTNGIDENGDINCILYVKSSKFDTQKAWK